MSLKLPFINERPEKLSAAVHVLSQHGSLEERGAVFTRKCLKERTK